MDAYSEMVMRLSNARLAELCREAERARLVGSLPRRWWRRTSVPVPVELADVTELSPAVVDAEPLRRTA
ncbi:MAG: hypothetical protein QOE93_261 [Actinomycetota bacterium]|jgi:hypothetical protein|nr:hypothetical protein [Actinomycetota bacterium]